MTTWKLIGNIIPPMSKLKWENEFDVYKNTPEYKYNEYKDEMLLYDFKRIYYKEWIHRIWGRSIGIIFGLPALYFMTRKSVPYSLKKRIVIYGCLIGFQGVLGWYMVKSGLDKEKDWSKETVKVSKHRLAAHMGTAVGLYCLMFWSTLTILKPVRQIKTSIIIANTINKMRKLNYMFKLSLFSTIIMGSYVAGLRAGLVYNSWPKFADRWIPEDIFFRLPFYKNFYENPVAVQFIHRSMAYMTLIISLNLAYISSKCNSHLSKHARYARNTLVTSVIVQIALGIFTVLHYVPTSLALLHQTNSIGTMSSALWLAHEIRKIPK
ncbi:hypothetical protein A3Q56_07307 [Intoshia linei]|uniref:Cytochrome c oxidase assembly protein COX15 n=1 Tax=Intoshia linei TaxID=1819745 RepID=A0A177ASM0_9BILA|nr:hypothetical protein A3Q56_07307 [Intoshia linei]